MKTLKIANDVYWLGVQDHDLEVFDIVMETKYGTSYNSYLIKGSEKTALVDTAKYKYVEQYIDKVSSLVSLNQIDYLIVHHTEPDHAGSIEKMLELNPNLTIVASPVAINYLKNIVNTTFNTYPVKGGDTLSLGDKTLNFISAPNLHWPDTIYSYLEEEHLLFTCDSFGSHYAFDEVLMSKLPASQNEAYLDALYQYYVPIFSPFKSFVIKAIELISNLEIKMICPGHGPVLDDRVEEVVNTYKQWSTLEQCHEKSVVICYTSAYGYTQLMAKTIEENILAENLNVKVYAYDLNVKNYEALKPIVLEQIKTADALLIGASTINRDAVAIVWDLLANLSPIVHGGKIGAAFGSYGWSGEAPDYVHARLEQLKFKVLDPVKVCFKPTEEKLESSKMLGQRVGRCVEAGKLVD
ncbi:MAG TPA: FprA family A-type flavoprotein [Firmicutes bacterium]|nr:FprA family A-type flavoprotein [Bacillota bacterium]